MFIFTKYVIDVVLSLSIIKLVFLDLKLISVFNSLLSLLVVLCFVITLFCMGNYHFNLINYC